MKILKMTASFGKLQDTLELHDGLNVFSLPNEGGKSTWSAFLCIMFYGPAKENKSKKNPYPEKTRYFPWNGKPLEGTVTLEHEGRQITLERTSTPRAPMGVFRAYDTQTGNTIPGLTGENCGQVLLGVERSVFERTAFLRQSGLALSTDPALEQRLNALVATGDTQNTYSQLSDKLKKMTNACGGRNGQISECECRLKEIEEKLAKIGGLQDENMAQAVEKQQLSRQLARLQRAEQAKNAQLLARAKQEFEQRTQKAEEAEALCKKLPSMEALQALRRQARQLAAAEREATADSVAMPQLPTPPKVFFGLNAEQALAKAHEDAALFQTSPKPETETVPAFCGLDAQQALERARLDTAAYDKQPQLPEAPTGFHDLPPEDALKRAQEDAARCKNSKLTVQKSPALRFVFLAVAVLGVALSLWKPIIGLPIAVLALAASCIAFSQSQKKRRAADAESAQAREILARYGVNSPEELERITEQYRAAQDAYRENCQQAEQARQALLARYQAQSPADFLRKANTFVQQTANQQAAQRHQQDQLALYGASSPEEFVPMAEAYAQSLAAFAREKAHAEQLQAQIAQRQAECSRANAAFFATIAQYAPCSSFSQAEDFIASAERAHAAANSAGSARDTAQKSYESLLQAVGEASASDICMEDLPTDLSAHLSDQIANTQSRLYQLEQQLSHQQGQMETIGDTVGLHAAREQNLMRLDELKSWLAVLNLTSEHLRRANDTLQTRFSPQIAAQAGQIFSRLTDGRYEKLLLDQALQVQVQSGDSPALRVSELLSCGTVDQLYLAVRLAMVHLLLPPDTPLVLDDALTNFDDTRAAKALELLQEEAATRQILLFTCHSREQTMLSESGVTGWVMQK